MNKLKVTSPGNMSIEFQGNRWDTASVDGMAVATADGGINIVLAGTLSPYEQMEVLERIAACADDAAEKIRAAHEDDEQAFAIPIRALSSDRVDEVGKELAELEAAGLIEHNGEYRKGQPVFVRTEFGAELFRLEAKRPGVVRDYLEQVAL